MTRAKQKWSITPLGVAVASIAAISLLLLLTGGGGEKGVGLLPSSWSSSISGQKQTSTESASGNGNGNGGSGWTNNEEEEEDSAPLLPLPYQYHTLFPSRTLPSSLLTPHLYPLAERLNAFLHRPIHSHEEAKKDNYHGCPRELSDKLVNPDQYNGDGDFWRDVVDKDEIAKRRSDVVNWLAERAQNGQHVLGVEGKTGKGKGIVLTGGNQDTTLRTITVLKHLRRLNVDLPIEVFHYSDELHDQNQRKEIESLGATLREATGLEKFGGVWKNWQIKGLALVQSSFREIIYLDSDNVPLRSPSHLFTSSIYKSSGRAVFWPDLSKDHPDNAIWRIVGDTCSLDLWTFESGQIVIDKMGNNGLNYAALLIAAGMMEDREFWFKMCGGDKDTFRWAWRILDIDFGVSPRWMSALGINNGYENGRFCGHSVLQYDLVTPEGFSRPPPLFVHSNLLKHLGGSGLHKGNLFTHIRRMSNDYSSSPSLNYAHSWVYNGQSRGMCLDLDWHDGTPDSIKNDEYVETLSTEEEEGEVFKGFEESWFDEGGRIGGW